MQRCPVCDERVIVICPDGHRHDLSGNRLRPDAAALVVAKPKVEPK